MDKSQISQSVSSIVTHVTHLLNCLATLESDHRPKSNIICDQEKLLIQTSRSQILKKIQLLYSQALNIQDLDLLTPDIPDIDHRLQTLDSGISLGKDSLEEIKLESMQLLVEIQKVLYL